ncbi:MAG: hypothetical protein ACOC95_07865 [Planctomycetota bacterium]
MGIVAGVMIRRVALAAVLVAVGWVAQPVRASDEAPTAEAFLQAVRDGDKAVVVSGLAAHPEWVHETTGPWDCPPLHCAADAGHVAIVRLAAGESPRAIRVTGEGVIDVGTRRLDGADYVFVLGGEGDAQMIRLETKGLGETLALHDALRDVPCGAAGGAYRERVAPLDLRIWRLTPRSPGR